MDLPSTKIVSNHQQQIDLVNHTSLSTNFPPCWAGGLEIETNKGGVNRLEKLETWKV